MQSSTGKILGRLPQSSTGSVLGKMFPMNIDIVFVLDVTASMSPIIDRCKKLISEFDSYILGKMRETNDRSCHQLRARLITYRDLYVEKDKYAYDSTDFIILAEDDKLIPEGQRELKKKLSEIKTCGGGDEPESSLEALAMAMQSDWSYDSEKLRHIIVLFTDASAHELELVKQCPHGAPEWFPPEHMLPKSLSELVAAWNMDTRNGFTMEDNKLDRRLVLYVPNTYPWNNMENTVERLFLTYIERGNGGSDITTGQISDTLLRSVK